MNYKWSISSFTGILAFIIFTIFTFTSVALYPTPYNPLYDWLSNLGNINFNPVGAAFFNWGCIITGLILIPFFMGLYRWRPEPKYCQVLLFIGIILGIFASISLIGVGIFPETHIKQHILAATGVFGSLFIIIILLSISLFKHPKFIHLVAYWGILSILIDISFKIIMFLPQYKDALTDFNPTVPLPGLEWAAVFSSLIWVLLISWNMFLKKV
jgi:hypothetical membrane protein